jgi:hypothetical protein
MPARAQNLSFDINSEVFYKLQSEIQNRYSIDSRLASEMAWDLMEVLSAVEGDIEIFEKYILH